MNVCRAEPRDAPAIAALYRVLVPGDGNVAVEPARLAELQGDRTNQLFVVEQAESVCGSAFLTICLDAMYGFQPYAVVENVIVLPAARGQGAGRALLVALEQAARAARSIARQTRTTWRRRRTRTRSALREAVHWYERAVHVLRRVV